MDEVSLPVEIMKTSRVSWFPFRNCYAKGGKFDTFFRIFSDLFQMKFSHIFTGMFCPIVRFWKLVSGYLCDFERVGSLSMLPNTSFMFILSSASWEETNTLIILLLQLLSLCVSFSMVLAFSRLKLMVWVHLALQLQVLPLKYFFQGKHLASSFLIV